MNKTYRKNLASFIDAALKEDIGEGDHTTFSCIPGSARGKANCVSRGNGIISGVEVSRRIFQAFDPDVEFTILAKDGSHIHPGDIPFTVTGRIRSILQLERFVLNVLQRMSGIATLTHSYVGQLKGLKTKIMDTRKTTPCMRFLEKEAVRTGGGENHRMGLYDMIMLKDNHIDYAGGIENAIARVREYLQKIKKNLPVEIEARNLDDVRRIINAGMAQRILLDNFTVGDTRKAVEMINGRFETESSGGITLKTIRSYAECGVDYISVGALTHRFKSLDLSLKAEVT